MLKLKMKYRNFRWKYFLTRFFIFNGLLWAGGIPLILTDNIVGFLAFGGIVVAAFATYVSIQSLEITRNTQRPFINTGMLHGCSQSTNNSDKTLCKIDSVNILVCNHGVYPAESVKIDCEAYNNNWSGKNLFVSNKKEPTIYFPNEDIYFRFDEANKEQHWVKVGSKVQMNFTITYKNKLTDKTHKTIRAFVIECNPTAVGIETFPEGDYWD